jgi:hypothetical protein
MSGTYITEIVRGYDHAAAFDGVIGSDLPALTRFQPHLEVLEPIYEAWKRAGVLPRVVFTPMARWPEWIAAYQHNGTSLRPSLAVRGYRGHPDYKQYRVGTWVAGLMGNSTEPGPKLEALTESIAANNGKTNRNRRALVPLMATVLAACIKRPGAARPPEMPYTLTRDKCLGGLPYQAGCSRGQFQEVQIGPDQTLRHNIQPGVHIKLAPLGSLAVQPFNPTILATEVSPCIRPVECGS